jgi:hypothetical protein
MDNTAALSADSQTVHIPSLRTEPRALFPSIHSLSQSPQTPEFSLSGIRAETSLLLVAIHSVVQRLLAFEGHSHSRHAGGHGAHDAVGFLRDVGILSDCPQLCVHMPKLDDTML